MYLVAIGWIYVVGMVAIAEALSSQGTVLGAVITFVAWGVLPLAIVLYILGTPARKAALRASEQQAGAAAASPEASPRASLEPDRGGHAAGDAVAPKREET
jgi:hypothetical protein